MEDHMRALSLSFELYEDRVQCDAVVQTRGELDSLAWSFARPYAPSAETLALVARNAFVLALSENLLTPDNVAVVEYLEGSL
jgi:hypothetical protein